MSLEDPVATSDNRDRGHLFIVSAPSGAGKSTLCRALLKRYPEILFSVSYTTRQPRSGEQNGVDYMFISTEDFEADIARGRWAEWAKVHDNYYGTSADFLDRNLARNRDILLDIDVQGTRQILKRYPDSVTIFIMPPSLETLAMRLESRGADTHDTIMKRLDNAKDEIAQRNMYRHVIINDQLGVSTREFIELIDRYRTAGSERMF